MSKTKNSPQRTQALTTEQISQVETLIGLAFTEAERELRLNKRQGNFGDKSVFLLNRSNLR